MSEKTKQTRSITMQDQIIAQYQATRAFPSYGKGRPLIHVDARAYTLGGNQHPYFSITATIDDQWTRRNNDCRSCGCLHDEILRLWPQLAPIVALHLSDANTGEPMHAEANGFYHLAGATSGHMGEQYHAGNSKRNFPIAPPADKPWQDSEHRLPTQDECLASMAEHLRIPLDEAREIRSKVVCAYVVAADGVALSDEAEMAKKYRQKAGNAAARKVFKTCVDALRAQWQAEAQAGIALLNKLSAKQAERLDAKRLSKSLPALA